jgi:hypothetical protein
MVITERDIQVLLCLARYHLLKRPQLQQLCYPTDNDGRITRRRLAALAEMDLIRSHYMRVASQYDDPPSAIYLLTPGGCRFLAEETAEAKYLFKPVCLPHALHLSHQLAVSELHMILDSAIANQSTFTLEAWYNEFEVINPNEPDPERHFRLLTEFQARPRRICAPDAAFMLNYQGRQLVFYVEMDRGEGNRGTNTKNLVRQKSRGYAELARQGLHRKHFPSTNAESFTVLLIAPHAQRRDALRRAFGRKDPAFYRTDLWRFAAMADLNVKKLLLGRFFYRCHDLSANQRVMAVGR